MASSISSVVLMKSIQFHWNIFTSISDLEENMERVQSSSFIPTLKSLRKESVLRHLESIFQFAGFDVEFSFTVMFLFLRDIWLRFLLIRKWKFLLRIPHYEEKKKKVK